MFEKSTWNKLQHRHLDVKASYASHSPGKPYQILMYAFYWNLTSHSRSWPFLDSFFLTTKRSRGSKSPQRTETDFHEAFSLKQSIWFLCLSMIHIPSQRRISISCSFSVNKCSCYFLFVYYYFVTSIYLHGLYCELLEVEWYHFQLENNVDKLEDCSV